jgi:hypothetical protein
MTGLRFLFRVTLRRLDLAGEIYLSGMEGTGLVGSTDLLDGNELSVARTAIAHARGV